MDRLYQSLSALESASYPTLLHLQYAIQISKRPVIDFSINRANDEFGQ